MKGVVLAGANSGAGKTTVSLALMAALSRRGLKVAAFKVGPDFIDPGHHALASKRPSHNLDGWMLPAEENRAVFSRHSAGADVAVVEGVMGLYDGFDPKSDSGSTAEMARLLGLPVLLVVNARSMARSFAALVRGYMGFGPGLSWAGVLANNVGGPSHTHILGQAMEQADGAVFLGGLPRRSDLTLPERHLGLVTAAEAGFDGLAMDRLADWLEDSVDLGRLCDRLPDIEPAPARPQAEPGPEPVTLAVARDRAFCFYYQENLRRLQEAGANLAFFSCLSDSSLPKGARGLYLGGGYPELHAEKLSANRPLMKDILQKGRSGMPMYAECGGMMYLGRGLKGLDGKPHAMTGLLPLEFSMLPRLRSLGYREVCFLEGCILGRAGAKARGHEFHYSEVCSKGAVGANVYRASGRMGPLPDVEGYRSGNVLASYIHLHFGSNPGLARSFVGSCRAWKG